MPPPVDNDEAARANGQPVKRPGVLVPVLLLLVLLLAGYTRLTNWAGVFDHDHTGQAQVFYGGVDSYYHMRRVQLTIHHYPRVPFFDAYVNHPEGATLDWPATFDFVLATLCLAGQHLSGSTRAAEVIAALFSPALGVLVCFLIYRLGRRLGGPGAGLVAGLLAALLPLLSGYSIVGRVDHHSAEPLLLTIPLLLLLWAMSSADPARLQRRAATIGLSLALSITVWPGAIVVSSLLYLALVVGILLRPGRKNRELRSRICCIGVWSFAAACVSMSALSLLHPWAARGSFAYFAPSLLQPTLFAVAGAAFWLLTWLERLPTDTNKTFWARRTAAAAGLPLAAFGLLLLLVPDLRATLTAALGYLFRTEAQISGVTESRPLLASGLSAAVEQYTALAALAPVLVVYLFVQHQRNEAEQRLRLEVCLLWLLASLALALAQLRLGSLLAPLWCALWGYAARDLYHWLRRRSGRPWLAGLLVAGALVLALLPTLALHRPVKIRGLPELVNSYDALRWLRDRAPSPGDAMEPKTRPRFSVLARWQLGHWLNYLAGQANVANPLGQTPVNLRGVGDSVRFFLAENPSAAHEILSRRQVRYVLVHPLLEEIPLLTRHLGWPVERLLQRLPDGKLLVKPIYFRTMQTRLLHYDGRRFKQQGRRHAPLRRLRLVYECQRQLNELGRRLSYCKVFEVVRGARLAGRARPGERIELALRLRTNLGRSLLYRDSAVADALGRYRFTVPYPTGKAGSAVAAGPCRLQHLDGALHSVRLSSRAVQLGETVDADPPHAPPER